VGEERKQKTFEKEKEINSLSQNPKLKCAEVWGEAHTEK